MHDQLPRYFEVNDRPVKLVETNDGGMDCLALNLKTGDFERDMSYLSKVMLSDTDVDEVSEDRFQERVDALRTKIASEREERRKG